jgi:DnaJ-class molecular chaperone
LILPGSRKRLQNNPSRDDTDKTHRDLESIHQTTKKLPERNMVCVECNGKGYCIINDREVVCDECLGHGEHPGRENKEGQKPVSHERHG